MVTDEEWEEWRTGNGRSGVEIVKAICQRTGMSLRDIMDEIEKREYGIKDEDLTPLALYKAIQALRNELLG